MKNESKLKARLAEAATKVTVGAQYKHYKNENQAYTVTALAIREEDCESCVVYQAEYGEHVTYIRPVANWLAEIDVDGKKANRFTKLS